MDVPDIPLGEIASLVQAFPQARFVLLNGLGYPSSPLGHRESDLPANYLIEISRLDSLLANEIGQLIASLGAIDLCLGRGCLSAIRTRPCSSSRSCRRARKTRKGSIGETRRAGCPTRAESEGDDRGVHSA